MELKFVVGKVVGIEIVNISNFNATPYAFCVFVHRLKVVNGAHRDWGSIKECLILK